MRIVIALVSFLLSVNTVFGQGSDCCRLVVVPPTVGLANIEVTVTNIAELPVFVSRGAAEFDLRIEILGENGSTPDLTNHAKRRVEVGVRRRVKLNRGEAMAQTLDLRTLYVLKSGTYTVTVSRDVFAGERKVTLQGKTVINVR